MKENLKIYETNSFERNFENSRNWWKLIYKSWPAIRSNYLDFFAIHSMWSPLLAARHHIVGLFIEVCRILMWYSSTLALWFPFDFLLAWISTQRKRFPWWNSQILMNFSFFWSFMLCTHKHTCIHFIRSYCSTSILFCISLN